MINIETYGIRKYRKGYEKKIYDLLKNILKNVKRVMSEMRHEIDKVRTALRSGNCESAM